VPTGVPVISAIFLQDIPSSSRRMRKNRRANDALLCRQKGKLFFRELACAH
jgi:hypothetical protein